MMKLPNANRNNRNLPIGLERIRKISIEKRLQIKPYFLILSISMVLILLAVSVKDYASFSAPLKLSVSDSFVFLLTYLGAGYLFLVYVAIYRQEEKAVFFLRKFLRNSDCCSQGIRISTKDFEVGIKAYQKTLPSSYWMLNIEEKVKQLKLVLDRGTKEDKTKARMFLQSLTTPILVNDTECFDNIFSEFNSFLMKKMAEKEDIIRITYLPIHDKWGITFRRIFWTGLEKVMPYLILFFFVASFYVIFHISLPWT